MTAWVSVAALVVAYKTSRDVFHPLILAVPMILAMYVFLPLKLLVGGSLTSYLSIEELQYIQVINLLGITAFCFGCLKGGWGGGRGRSQGPAPLARNALWASLILGGIGVLGYLIMISNAGGFVAAYGRPHGGGVSPYGYIRDSVNLCIPACVLIMTSARGRKLSQLERAACGLFAAPFLIQGVLSTSRGSFFVVVTALAVSWYWKRRRRPRMSLLYAAGLVMGALVLFLASNRSSIHLGSNWDVDRSPFALLKAGSGGISGDEYIYGAGSIIDASAEDRYFWGRRYFAAFFINPIPRQIWPDKYEAAGIPQIERNFGTEGKNFRWVLGWEGGSGSATGMVADMWLEFWWFSLLALGFIGWAYGRWWWAARWKGGFYQIAYVVAVSLLVYLIFQDLDAMLFVFMEMVIPAWALWRLGRVQVCEGVADPGGAVSHLRAGPGLAGGS